MAYIEIKRPVIKKVVVSGKQFYGNVQALVRYVWGVQVKPTKDIA